MAVELATAADLEANIIGHESGLEGATELAKLGEKVRHLKEHGLAEV
jgi:hypothetical protein